MLRSLVGSEMCIRDRYQRRVRGLPTDHRCKTIANQPTMPNQETSLMMSSMNSGKTTSYGASINEDFMTANREAAELAQDRNWYDSKSLADDDENGGIGHEQGGKFKWWTDYNAKAVFVIGCMTCLLYTSDAADEEDSVDLGGRRIIKKKKKRIKKKVDVKVMRKKDNRLERCKKI
eukprot:TRINITY_DN6664_c0_g1_i12.p1 TRINITY_DN6664_c0_g1~~TRINITY_DN6664_c0_g1_i12.p1  ORF type:complete len:176 (-),score=65.66 TRINITY_DN6664_c0_g1_i12:56-583(-)